MSTNQFERVASLLRTAALANEDAQKVENLHQVKELIIKHDSSLLDNFFEEVVAFQHYPSTELKKFIVKFIEESCLVDAGLLLKSVSCLSHLFNLSLHQEPPLSSLLRAVIQSMSPLYRRAMTRAVKSGFIESGALGGCGIEANSVADNALENFRSVAALKDEIIRLLLPSSVGVMQGSTLVPPPAAILTRLCASISDPARISIINLIETVIVTQSRRMPTSVLPRTNDVDISLDQIPDLPNSLLKSIIESSTAGSSTTALPGICLIRPRRLSDEADRLFTGLTNLPLKRSDETAVRLVLTSSVFDALMDSLVSIARQRPQFLDRAVQTFETVHVNLPTHFSQVQVNSARQKLKSGLLELLQHPSAVSEFQSRITILLTDLGATQSEVISAMNRVNDPKRPDYSQCAIKTSTDVDSNLQKLTNSAIIPPVASTAKPEGPVIVLGLIDPQKLAPTVENKPLEQPSSDSNKSFPISHSALPSESSSTLNFGEDDDEDDDDEDISGTDAREPKRRRRTSSQRTPTDPRSVASRRISSIDETKITGTNTVLSAKKSAATAKKAAADSAFIPEIDEIAEGLVPKLTSANVADLVLLSMVMLPDEMPVAFNATYTPIAAAGTTPQIRHLARLLSAQLSVWVSGEEKTTIKEQNRQLLMKLFEDVDGNGATNKETSGRKSSGTRSRKSKIDEDDEAAFMKAHAARVHSTTKPMNITVLNSTDRQSSLIPQSTGASLLGSTMSPNQAELPALLFNPNVPPPPANIITSPLVKATPTTIAPTIASIGPARPFSLDSVVTQMPRDSQRILSREAFLRILLADGASWRKSIGNSSGGVPSFSSDETNSQTLKPLTLLASTELAAYDSARIKLLCRLPNKRFSSSDLYPIIINFAIQNLKDGYELLANLLMHEYTCYRGFQLASFNSHLSENNDVHQDEKLEPKPTVNGSANILVPEEDAEEAMVLEQSKQQLRALENMKRGIDEYGVDEHDIEDVDEICFSDLNEVTKMQSSDEEEIFLSSKLEPKGEVGQMRKILPSPALTEELGSLSFYDAVLTEILTRLSAPEVKETYFGRLLLEAPLLTMTAVNTLKRYCWSTERAPHGFQILRQLIELRPTGQRKELLEILLNFASVDDVKIRRAAMKAVCELAESHQSWEEQIETYASNRLKKLLLPRPPSDLFSFSSLDVVPANWTNECCQACAYLLVGLMPRNPRQLLLVLAQVYVHATDTVKRTLLRMMDTSICEIGLHSPDLLNLIDECPPGAETLVTRMISVLTDPRTAYAYLRSANFAANSSALTPGLSGLTPTGASSLGISSTLLQTQTIIPVMPPPALVDRVRRLYATRVQDVRCLIPVIVGLTKQEVIAALPKLVQLNEKVVKEVISRLLHASVATLPAPDPRFGIENLTPTDAVVGPLTPEELLVAIHLLEFSKDQSAPVADGATSTKPHIDIRVILRACLHCFAERRLFTQERLSAAIGQLLDQPVLPTLFLRTVMQALALYPRLAGYVINVLFRLIRKQVWKSPALWDGFIRCCVKTRPQCYQVLLQLPPQQLQSVFDKEPNLRAQVLRYVENFSSAQRMHISRAVVEVLQSVPTPPKPSSDRSVGAPQEVKVSTSTTLPISRMDTDGSSKISEKIQDPVASTPCAQIESASSDTVAFTNSPCVSSESVTPTKDEDPIRNSVPSNETSKVSESPFGSKFKLSFEASFADDDSLSPPTIVTSTTYNPNRIISRGSRPQSSALIASESTNPQSHDLEQESYSPPPLATSRRIPTMLHEEEEELDFDFEDSEMVDAHKPVSPSSPRPSSQIAVKKHVDGDKLEADKRRLEEAFKIRQAGGKSRKQTK